MRISRILFFSVILIVGACSDNEATLVSMSNQNNINNANNENNGNNANNENNTNNANNTNNTNNENNANNVNNEDPIFDIYSNELGPDNRDYTGTLPARPGDEVEGFVFDMVEAFCTRALECRDEAFVRRNLSDRSIGTVGECVTRYFNINPAAGFSDAVASGRAQSDPDDFAACIDAVSTGDCIRVGISLDAPRSQFQVCQEALRGLSGPQESCGSAADCRIDTRCERRLSDTCVGRCTRNLPQGVLCGSEVCELDEFCAVGEDEERVCEKFRLEGEECGDDVLCDQGLFCLSNSCQPVKVGFQEGEQCNDVSNLCAAGLVCDFSAEASNINVGRCAERFSQGTSCGRDEDCLADLSCQESTCEPRIGDGTCSFSSDCVTEICREDSTCFPPDTVCDF